MRYILLCILLSFIIGCKTTGEHWLRNSETGKLELVEYIEMRGTAKHEIEFSTKGKAKADSGLSLSNVIPDINIEDLKTN